VIILLFFAVLPLTTPMPLRLFPAALLFCIALATFQLRAGLRHRITYIPELLSTYRLHKDSKTVAQANKAAPELEYMYRKFFARPDLPDEIRALERQALVNMFFTSGGYYLEGGNSKAAARMGFRALRSNPSAIYRPEVAHKFLYCLLGGRSIYQRSRGAYQKARTTLEMPESNSRK